MIFFLVILFASHIFSAAPVPSQWTKEDYPNPQIDYKECGRESASWVCDPNGIISKNASDKINSIFYHIEERLSPGYSGNFIALAIASQMKTPLNDSSKIYSTEFSTYLYSKWIGKQNSHNGLVIFFSKMDHTLSIHIGDGIKNLFHQDAVQLLITNMKARMFFEIFFLSTFLNHLR